MNQLAIELEKTNFRPGETIRGRACWDLDVDPKGIELRLMWFTRGEGDYEFEVVERVPFSSAARREQRDFEIRLPASPYSFRGQLITVVWELELSGLQTDGAFGREIVVSPTLEVIELGSSDRGKVRMWR